MFTGIVQALGAIVRVEPFEVDAGNLDLAGVGIGDSIAVQGVCLTVTALTERGFAADVSRETLSVTAGLDRVGPVNLERALRVGDALGGHLMSGHVDGVGEVVRFDDGLLRVRVPADLARYVARKGSICLDGVSLTVNRVDGETFDVNLIPHTLEVTTLSRLAAGAKVNIEVDQIARYVERLLASTA